MTLGLFALACASSTTPAPSSRPVSLDAARLKPVTDLLDSAVASGAAPGAVFALTYNGARFVHTTGQLGADDATPPEATTIYDLASLTKVVALLPGLMQAVSEGTLDLDAPVQQYLPSFAGGGKYAVTVRMLLVHAGGLPAWRPLFREAHGRAEVFALADTAALESPPGTREVYSDLGAIILTQILETLYHDRLDSILGQRVFRPLGMSSTGYRPGPELQPRIAPTELDPWRGRVLRGEVHDENAAAMEGVSGHAGLFSTAEDLLTFAEWMLEQGVGRSGGQAVGQSEKSEIAASIDHPTIRPSVLQEFIRRQTIVPGSSRALGWDTPSPGSSAGNKLSSRSFGHTGFTGTSLWIDPERRVGIILLSNRVNPTRDNPRWAPLRGQIADLVMTSLFEDSR
jgi:serine-type D-Ala-D-Ala carboxypeptidase